MRFWYACFLNYWLSSSSLSVYIDIKFGGKGSEQRVLITIIYQRNTGKVSSWVVTLWQHFKHKLSVRGIKWQINCQCAVPVVFFFFIVKQYYWETGKQINNNMMKKTHNSSTDRTFYPTKKMCISWNTAKVKTINSTSENA